MQWLPYVLGAIIVLFAAMQLRVVIVSRRARGKPAPALDAWLAPEQTGFDRYLVYFFSPRCGPCRAMGPHVDALADHHANVLKVDISDENDLALARAFGVLATPTTVLVRGGIIERVLVGGVSQRRLESLLD
ncbi:MAG: thioredoxin family protein [Gammaproteobacteria bacterium]